MNVIGHIRWMVLELITVKLGITLLRHFLLYHWQMTEKEPPIGETFVEVVAGFTGIVLLADGLYELGLSFLAPEEAQLRAMAVAKVLGGISTLVVDVREMRLREKENRTEFHP